MKVKVKRFDKKIPLPKYQTKGSACLDLYSRKKTEIQAKNFGYIPLNIALEIPKDHFVLVAARGSTHRHGLIPIHGIGIGDWDFKGDGDEYVFPVYNFTNRKVIIKKGTRIAQMMVLKYEPITLEEVKSLRSKDRGKLGSTGYK